MCAGKVTVALLHADDEALRLALLFQIRNKLANIFEAGEQINRFGAIFFRYGGHQLCGHNGFHHDRILWQRPFCLSLRQQVIRQQRPDLVARHQTVFLTIAHGDANAVAIRICRKQEVRRMLLCKLQRTFKRLTDFRIREGAGGEVAVWQLLLRNNRYICNPGPAQHLPHRLVSRAVERSVNHLQAGGFTRFRMHALGKHTRIKLLDQALLNQADPAIPARLVKPHALDAFKQIHLFNAAVGFLRRLIRHLIALGIIALIAIVFGRVMAGSDDNAGLAAQPAHRKGEHRSGHQLREKMHHNAVGREHAGGLPRKKI